MSPSRGYRAAIIANRLCYMHADGTALFSDLTFTVSMGKYGLLGPNGIGKTTLLRMTSGELEATAGSLKISGTSVYLDQHDETDSNLLASELLLGLDPASVARAKNRLGLLETDLERPYLTLSGGERMRLRLARAIVGEPDWLLLDEPTNHLDEEGRAALYELLASWPHGLIAASHDRELLERVDCILELSTLGLRTYGGKYSFYAEQRRLEDESVSSDLRSAESRLDHEARDLVTSLERTQRNASHAKKRARKENIPKVMRGAMERAAQTSTGKRAGTHQKRLERARDRLQAARDAMRNEPAIVLDLPQTEVHAKKVVATVRGLNVLFPGSSRLWNPDLDLDLIGPAKLAIHGRNGSGKTTLLRLLAGEVPAPGRVTGFVGTGVRAAYLDQHLDFLPKQLSLVEAMRAAAPHLSEHDRRIRLGRLLFEQARGLEQIGHLSGGERVRAALALLLWQPESPQLLLLDEPTNNLDLRSMQHLVDVLRSYHGAIMVVSHERWFIEAIGVEGELRLTPAIDSA